ncbi:TetR/AcrR family transcriptional regulator [Brevibacillus nitrificans]|uniref:TetR/AcrR family transcriptional regulator n=1 Tax=Brevibacillus nitrificans TaxID=651560 RepID=A0A3M8D4T3_9BACL|nr:TetR/AcrR family transcriptional regulator [Brevibacillus nitrificans]RNB83040.1 TetR/AcrR family transcriptional regulator [Brevibacillus nitrificans]
MTTKEKIKNVALVHFATHGYEGATLTAIATEVGIKTPSMYAFFVNKEELFLQIFEETQKEYNLYVIRAITKSEVSSVQDKLYGVLMSSFQYNQQQKDKISFYRRVILFPPPSLEEQIKTKLSVTEEILSNVLQAIFLEGMEQGVIRKIDIEVLVDAFYCLMDGVFMEMSLYDGEKFERKLLHAWNTFWSGITYGAAIK